MVIEGRSKGEKKRVAEDGGGGEEEGVITSVWL